MAKKIKILTIFLAALAIIITSCATEYFLLDEQMPERVVGYKMTSLDSVEKMRTNQFKIYDGGMCSLRKMEVTQLLADFTVEVDGGEGIRFAFRTVRNKYEQQPKIAFDYTPNGTVLKENDEVIADVDSIKLEYNEPKRVVIKNDGRYYYVTVDCDTVHTGYTRMPATEFVIIETLPGSNAVLSGIDFAEILDKF